jgi:hypothetical protein
MKFDPNDWDIPTQVEEGSEGIVYGNYVEWDDFRKDNEEELLEYFCVELPWNKTLTFDTFLAFLSQEVFQETDLFDKYLRDKLELEECANFVDEISFEFIDRNDNIADDLVSEIFDYYEVPSGTKYEFDLPEKLRYWQDTVWDYEEYLRYPITIEKYIDTINDVFNKITSCTEVIIKKSLVLSALIITESMFKSIIVIKIPEESEISDFSKSFLEKEIDKILRGNIDGKNKLFKDLYNTSPPTQKWIPLRNALAHDVEGPEIIDDDIHYLNLKTGQQQTYNLNKLRDDLNNFATEIASIISNV